MESSNIQRKEYPLIDILKFAFSYVVVGIHVLFLYYLYTDYKGLNVAQMTFYAGFFRLAVPFYFTVSGYFLFSKMKFSSINMEIIRKYAFRIALIFALWSILLFRGHHEHLWYLTSLCFASLVVGLLLKAGLSKRSMIIICIVLFAIGLLGDSYYGVLENLKLNSVLTWAIGKFPVTRNGLFDGVPFVFIGALLSQKEKPLKLITAIIGLIVSIILMLCELTLVLHFNLPRDYNMFIAQLPAAYFLVSICLNVKTEPKPIYKSLRIIGIFVYLSHFMIYFYLEQIFDFIDISCGINLNNPWLMYFCIVAVATLLGILVERLLQKPKFGFLKYLF